MRSAKENLNPLARAMKMGAGVGFCGASSGFAVGLGLAELGWGGGLCWEDLFDGF